MHRTNLMLFAGLIAACGCAAIMLLYAMYVAVVGPIG